MYFVRLVVKSTAGFGLIDFRCGQINSGLYMSQLRAMVESTCACSNGLVAHVTPELCVHAAHLPLCANMYIIRYIYNIYHSVPS